MTNEVALDFLLEGFIDDALIDQCRGISIKSLVQDHRKARSGDLFLASPREVVVGLFAGDHPLSGKLALRFPPARMPISI